jgi:DNA gyrase subunit A
MIVTKNGQMIRINSSTIREVGRSTQGVRLVRLEEGDRVAAASLVPEDDSLKLDDDSQGDLPLQ